MNRPESAEDETLLNPLARRLLEIDEAISKQSTPAAETPRPVADPTIVPPAVEDSAPQDHRPPVSPSQSQLVDSSVDVLAEQCLEWIEAIRVTSPEVLHEAFHSPSASGPPFGVNQPSTDFEHTDGELFPARIGRFELLRQLGKGGYGIVFLAHDPALQRDVALKVPRPEVLVTADLRRRFLREAEAAAALDHRHIVSVYEAGSAGPVCYIASAFCPGVSLSQWLNERGQVMSPNQAAAVIAALADAVQHAHDRGVLHRDIKPGNVLIEESQESATDVHVDSVRLADFGLAQVMTESSDASSNSTAIVGTPAYMAPEQAANRRHEIGVATDVYGLGATLYHLLTGRPPIVGSSQAQTLSAILQVEPVDPGHYRADIPRDLSAICLKCLEKEALRRYQSATQLKQDLDRFLAGQQVIARPVGPLQRLTKWCKRNPGVSALSACLALAIVSTMMVALAGWWSTARALRREHLALVEADRAYSETKEAVDKYYVTVSETQLLNAPGMTPLRKELLAGALQYYTRFVKRHEQDISAVDELRKAYVRIADVHEVLGDLTAARQAYDNAMKQIELQIDDDQNVSQARLNQGMIHRKLARLDRRENQLVAAMEHANQAIHLQRGLIAERFKLEKNQDQLAQSLNVKAGILQSMGKLPEAIETYRDGELILERLITRSASSPELQARLAQVRGNQSIMLRVLGRLEESRPLLAASAEIYERLVDQHPDVASYRENLGKAHANLSTYASMGQDFDTSIQYLESATTLFDSLAKDYPRAVMYHALRASTRREAALALSQISESRRAEELFLETIAILEEVQQLTPHAGPIDLADARLGLAEIHFVAGEVELAQPLIEHAIRDLEEYCRNVPNEFFSSCSLGLAYQKRAQISFHEMKLADATDWLDKGLDVFRSLQQSVPENEQVKGLVESNIACRSTMIWLSWAPLVNTAQ